MKLVIVESPSKAKTINKYLGSGYRVLASFGHIRDLPSKSGSVDPAQDFKMMWEMSKDSQRHVDAIIKGLSGVDTLYLATDPDREGEAISWHVLEVLREKNLLNGIKVQRVVFYEITKSAIQKAMKNPRDLDENLIQSYLARRSLDYLVGFTLSPLLWTKLPGSKSAGRVQSVALRLVADREGEIEQFKPQEYWSIEGHFKASGEASLITRLYAYNGQKVEKFSFPNQDAAEKAQASLEKKTYAVDSLESKEVQRHPTPPFITSTLQQEAARKLRFSARRTMQIAQKLYEGMDIDGETVGLITYMRTDSVTLSQDALAAIRQKIQSTYGPAYLPDAPRAYKTKAKNAQEAHEAIRPTHMDYAPETLQRVLDKDQLALYTLIWKRTMACQMTSARFNKITLDLQSHDGKDVFRASGSTLVFDGFLKVYEEGRDDNTDEDKENLLPPVNKGQELPLEKVEKDQHFTQPPPRYTEASLVKKLEELGIGRPSTYATIMGTLLERKYVHLDKRALVPESLGRLVTAFLVAYFPKYVEYDFTASLEDDLDAVAHGKENWIHLLNAFWAPFEQATSSAKTLKISDVLTMLNDTLAMFLFPDATSLEEARKCPKCQEGSIHLKLSKYGGFLGCSRYPDCGYTRPFASTTDGEASQEDAPPLWETKTLGEDPRSHEIMTVRKGPYGYYIQWDPKEPVTEIEPPAKGKKKTKAPKPRRVSLPKGQDPSTLTLEDAIALTQLPKTIGIDPETQEEMVVALGRFGPYVRCGKLFASIPKAEDPTKITHGRGVELVKLARQKALDKEAQKDAKEPIKEASKAKPVKKAPKATKAPAKGRKKTTP